MEQPKQLLPWHERPMIVYCIEQLSAVEAITQVVVVLGHDAEAMRAALYASPGTPSTSTSLALGASVSIVMNQAYAKGKTTSIQAGLRALSAPFDAVLILATDQPRPAQVLSELIQAHFPSGRPVTVPTFGGKWGHPPVFSAALLPELLAISEERQGLREVMERHRSQVQEHAVDSAIVLTNLNTEAEYLRAHASDAG